MGRSAHVATENLTAVKIIQQNRVASTTITQGIEYNGTFYQVLWDGATSVTGSLTFVSDYIPVSIPAGATFWVRTYWQGTSGSIYNPWQNTFLGEAATLSATALTDQTLGGTITNSGAYSLPPMAIVGVTVNPSAILIGDSLVAGVGDTEDTSNSATGRNAVVGYFARSCRQVPFTNLGVQASTAAGFGNELRPILAVGSHVLCDFGTNDIYSSGASSATLIASLTAIFSFTRANQKCYQSTITPKTTSSDSWATTGNQTLVNSTQNTQRTTFNTALRNASSGIPHLAGYMEAANVMETSLNSGIWIVTGAANYATADGLHPSAAAVVLLVNAGAVPIQNWP